MTEIAAVHPQQQFYENGILREEPPYAPPRWKCDHCGFERPVKDYQRNVYYKDEAERPTEPVGWIYAFTIPKGPQYISDKQWHFCSLDCVAAYRGWLPADDSSSR